MNLFAHTQAHQMILLGGFWLGQAAYELICCQMRPLHARLAFAGIPHYAAHMAMLPQPILQPRFTNSSTWYAQACGKTLPELWLRADQAHPISFQPHENLIPCRLTDSNICPNLRVSFARNQFALFDLHHPQKNEYNYGRITCTTKQEVCRIQNEFIYFNKKFINMRGILFDSHVRSKNIKYIFQKMFSNAAHICGIFLVSLQLGEIPNLSVISLSLAKESEKLLPPNKLSTF